MSKTNDSLDRLEKFFFTQAADDYDKLKDVEIDIKRQEEDLISHQADLRFVKMSFQSFLNITDAFTKDLQTFFSKIKENKLKRLSCDMTSDLSSIKNELFDMDNKYKHLCDRLAYIKENVNQLLVQQRQLGSSCARFDSWLTDMEIKINGELRHHHQSLDQVSDVKRMEEMCSKFQSYKNDVQSERKSLDEIKRNLSNLNEWIQSQISIKTNEFKKLNDPRVNQLENRYKNVESLIMERYDYLIDRLTSTRNIKENLESTQSWLNEINQVYLLNNSLMIDPQNKNDQFESFERIKSELSSRKELLLKNLPSDSSIDQIIQKIDLINESIDIKASKSRILQSLLEQYSKNYDILNKYFKESANKLEKIDIINDASSSLSSSNKSNTKPAHFVLIKNCIQLIGEIKAGLVDTEQTLLEQILQPCLREIENSFVPDLFGQDQFRQLDQDLNDLKHDYNHLINLSQAKMNELATMSEMAVKYAQLKGDFEKWLQSIELKIHMFEPIAIDIEIVEKQYDQLQAAINEYDVKSSDLNNLNQQAQQYLALMSKYKQLQTVGDKQQQPVTKMNSFLKRKQLLRTNSSRYNSAENLNSESEDLVNLGSGYDTELEHESRKMNELYEWIGERLEERKKDLLFSLDQMKSYLQDLHSLDNRLNQFEMDLVKLFQIEKLTQDLTTIEIKLPLDLAKINQINAQFKQMDSDLNKFQLDIESVKSKGKQFIFDRLTNDTTGIEDVKRQLKELNDKYCHLNSSHASFKDKLDQYVSNFGSYHQNHDQLKHNLEQKQQLLNIMIMGSTIQNSVTNKISINSDLNLIDTQIKQVDLLKNDLVKQDSNLLDILNRNGEYLIEFSLKNSADFDNLTNELEKINNQYDYLSNQFNETLDYKYKLKDLCSLFSSHREKFYDKLDKIDSRLSDLQKQTQLPLTNLMPDTLINELNAIESDPMSECSRLVDLSKETVYEIIDITRNNLILNGNHNLELHSKLLQDYENSMNSEKPDDELSLKLSQMKNSLNNSFNNLNQIRNLVVKHLAKDKSYNQLYNDLKEFIDKKYDELKSFEKISTNLDKINAQQVAHETLTRQLIQRSEDVKKLIEYYTNKIDEDEEEQNNIEAHDIINDVEKNWNDLCSKSDAHKEKLFICYTMSEQFDNVYTFLKQYLNENDKKFQLESSDENLENKLKQIETYLVDLDKENVVNLTKLVKIGNELQQTCQLDKEQVQQKIDELKKLIQDIHVKLNDKLKEYLHLSQLVGEFENNCTEIKCELLDLDNEISITNNVIELENVQNKLVSTLRDKIDQCKSLNQNLPISKQSKQELTQRSEKLNELELLYQKLNSLVQFKLNEERTKYKELSDFQKELSKMDDKLKNIQEFLDNKTIEEKKLLTASTYSSDELDEEPENQTDSFDENALKAKQDRLENIKDSLALVNGQLKTATENLNKYLLQSSSSSGESESNDLLKKLQETVQSLTDKCTYLHNLQKKEEQEIREKSEQLNQLQLQIQACNAEILKCLKEFDSNMKPISSSSTVKSASISNLIAEHESYQKECLQPIKSDLDQINKTSKQLIKSKDGDSSINQMTAIEIQLEKLNNNYSRLDAKFQERANLLDMALFKSSKFEDKIKILNESLTYVETEMENLNKILFGFDNLDQIQSQLDVSDELTKQLVITSNEIDEFKDICEKIMQNCDDSNDTNIIEKRMDTIIYKWNILTHQLDEKKVNLNFLNIHLNQLNSSYLDAKKFVDELNLKFTSNLTLNCIEPIVIKTQFEKMSDLNNTIIENFHLINDLKLDANNLIFIHNDFENLNNPTDMAKSNEDEMNRSRVDNRFFNFLPKTISSAAVLALSNMLDKQDIEMKVNQIDVKYTDYKFLLGKNLNLMHRLYPLCEKFSHTIVQLNQSIGKFEYELEWLKSSSENETSQKDRDLLFNELKKNIVESQDVLVNLEGPLSARIIDELNTSNSFCDEFIADLNENINQVKLKFSKLNEKLEEYQSMLDEKQTRTKDLFGEIDDLFEWFDEVDSKLANLDAISYEPDLIKNQLNELLALNDELQKQENKLKQIIDDSKKMIRSKEIEDSIELKEKLTSLQMQSNNLHKMGSTRLNEIEQALAISTNFTESHRILTSWFDDIKKQLENVDKHHLESNLTPDSSSKDAIKIELSLLKQIDRELQEKKVEFETMNKNGFALAKLCNKNSGLLSSVMYGGSMIISSQNDQTQKDCPSAQHVKQMISYSNQRYESYKSIVNKRKDELEMILWKSAELTDKLDNLTNNLNTNVENCEYAEPISAHPDKLRLQLDENRNMSFDLEKRKQALEDLKQQLINKVELEKQLQMVDGVMTEQPINRENIEKKIEELDELWHQLKELSDSRAKALEETLECSETFWSDYNTLMEVVNDLEDRIKQIENETVAMDPDSVIEQQQYHEQIVREIDENEMNVNDFKEIGSRLMDMCGTSDQPEVQKTMEDLDQAWGRIKQLVNDRETELQQTFGKACEFQQELIEILEWISLQQEKFVNLDSSFTSNDPKTIRFQINLLKEFKDQVDPEQLKINILNQKFNDLKSTTKTNQSFDVLESLQDPLNSANKEWKRLQSSIIELKCNLQNGLLEMGLFNEALDEMLKWLESTDQALDEINLNSNDILSSKNLQHTANSPHLVLNIDIQSARLKVLKNDIKCQEQSVNKLKETGKNLIKNETTGKQTLDEIKQRVQLLTDCWDKLLIKLNDKQNILDNRLYESQSFQCDLQDAMLWLNEMELKLNVNAPFGGLPETAREQLDKFMNIYGQIELNESMINAILQTGRKLIENNNVIIEENEDEEEEKQQQQQKSYELQNQALNQSIEQLTHKWQHVNRKAQERKEKLEEALRDAIDFNAKLQKFIGWLTDMEKLLNTLKPVSRVIDTLTTQIGEHQVLQKNITDHREQMLDLDKLGTQLKYFSQKQDVILIKNLLISVQNRWEKIVSRSAERTRDLERGFKEAKQFYDSWKDLLNWLTTNHSILNQEQAQPIGNNPAKIKQLIAKHKEFHRVLSSKQQTYDSTVKLGRKLFDKCEVDANDRPKLQEMLNELKNKWQSLCYQSVERQKKLEDALLMSGQFRDALQSLIEWLSKVEPTLAESYLLNGDLDSVLALIEDNEQFQQQLKHKAEQVSSVRKAAQDLLSSNNTSNEDNANLQEQLDEMNDLWSRVEELSRDRTIRLEEALKLAKEFNAQVRSRSEWLSNAEQALKYNTNITFTDNESELLELIEIHQNFVRDLQDQEKLVQQCLELGQQLLSSCIPEATINLNHWIAVLQTRWEEVNELSEQKCKKLQDALEMCKENENILNELLAWLQGAEATLTALEQKPIINNLEQVEQLLIDHQDFQNEMQARQVNVERITKSSSVKDPFQLDPSNFQSDNKKKAMSVKSLNKISGSQSAGWRTPEPKMRNPKVKILFDRWRKVWLMSLDRQRKLREAVDRLKEMERLKNFSFEEWRRRYMNWHKDNRARITDFFRRQDRDHDGKISREEFIEGILSSSKYINFY